MARVRSTAELVNRTLDDDERVTQFEALTAAAYHELARQEVEVAVIEAGLGGRYDATNVIPSKVQVLTGVDLEHTRWLGPTIAAIAEEKLAVVRDHGILVTADLDPEAEEVAARVAAERHATRVRAGELTAARSERTARSRRLPAAQLRARRGRRPRRSWGASSSTTPAPARLPGSSSLAGWRSSRRSP